MNSHTRGTLRLDTYYTQLLWAIAKKGGGELRISGYDLDEVPDQCGIFTDWDQVTHELRIIASTKSSELVSINTEAQWTGSQRVKSTTSPEDYRPPQRQESPPRSAVLSDDDLARVEENLLRRAARRREERQASELNEAQRT